jgi:lipoprotein NlpD
VKRTFVLLALLACTLACTGYLDRTETSRGVYHLVQRGETLSVIARTYRVTVQDLAEYNNITDPDMIVEGSALFIPGAVQIHDIDLPAIRESSPSVPEPVAAVPPASPSPRTVPRTQPVPDVRAPSSGAAKPPPAADVSGKTRPAKDSGGAAVQARPSPPRDAGPPTARPRPAPATPSEDIRFERQRFIWPVRGPVKTRFGIQPNGLNANGIEIDAPENTPVLAAAGGTVIFSDTLKEYGETVILKHPDDFKTVYIQLKSRRVQRDQQVKRGEIIALTGKPEKKREPYWNFEIRYRNKARNPMFFLP